MKSYAFIGNWKMNKTRAETRTLAGELKALFEGYNSAIVAIAPPFTSLADAYEVLKGSNIKLCAQNCHWKEAGAFTGEISPVMLKELNVEFVILGHSERRQYFGETSSGVNMRAKSALKHGIIPVVCIGETREERENGRTLEVIRKQVSESLKDLKVPDDNSLIVAYEPVWAIGTGLIARPDQIDEVHQYIRKLLMDMFGNTGKGIKILYGGSVRQDNIYSFIKIEDVNGALVGGASLNAKEFFSIAMSVKS